MSSTHDEAEERKRREREAEGEEGKIKGTRKKGKGKEKEKEEEERRGEENIGRQKTDVQMWLSGICYLRHFSPFLF